VIEVSLDSRVALFVDFEHFQRPIRQYTSAPVSFVGTLEALVEHVRRHGLLVLANVYADWERYPGMPAELKRLQLDPRFVVGSSGPRQVTVTRSTAAVMSLALDALQTVFERPDISTFILVSGDAALLDLIGRLRGRQRQIVLMGFEQYVRAELTAAVKSFEPLDDFFQPGQFVGSDTPPSPDDYAAEGRTDQFDWEPFIALLARLEQSLPFIALKYLKNQVLTPAHGCDNTQESKARLIRDAIRLRLIETRKIPNPHNPSFATTACRLNRTHALVKRALAGRSTEA
jgi:hypothetical protein